VCVVYAIGDNKVKVGEVLMHVVDMELEYNPGLRRIFMHGKFVKTNTPRNQWQEEEKN